MNLLSGRFYRIVFAADLGRVLDGVRTPEARFHHSGQPALYLSPSPEAAGFAVASFVGADDPPRVLVPIRVEGARVVDLRDAAHCAALGLAGHEPSVPWQPERAEGRPATSWRASDAARASGADGMVYVARSEPSRWHLVLFRWNLPGGPVLKQDGPGRLWNLERVGGMTPEVQDILDRLASGEPLTSPPLTLTHCRIRGCPVTFCTSMENDPIQRKNRAGAFYETSDLYLLDRHFPRGGTFVDIGANIGNHSLYFALILGAGRVVPFEPNPLAYRVLVQNVLANGLLDRFDLSRLGVGLSDRREDGFGVEERTRNLGAAGLIPGGGEVETHRADALLANMTPDFIKIDVEGMEMKVLAGLSGLLARCRPALFVEVHEGNEAPFGDWVAAAGYPDRTRPRTLPDCQELPSSADGLNRRVLSGRLHLVEESVPIPRRSAAFPPFPGENALYPLKLPVRRGLDPRANAGACPPFLSKRSGFNGTAPTTLRSRSFMFPTNPPRS